MFCNKVLVRSVKAPLVFSDKVTVSIVGSDAETSLPSVTHPEFDKAETLGIVMLPVLFESTVGFACSTVLNGVKASIKLPYCFSSYTTPALLVVFMVLLPHELVTSSGTKNPFGSLPSFLAYDLDASISKSASTCIPA